MKILQNVVFCIVLVWCDIEAQTVKSLTGQVYFFANELDTNICRVSGHCDCCSSNILFIDSSNFVTVDYCEADEQIFKGTYQINNDNVLLNYDSLAVTKEFNWEMEADTTGATKIEYFLTTKNIKPYEEILTFINCKSSIYFKIGDKEVYYGMLDERTTIETFIERLKKDGIWEIIIKAKK